jgi:hypothetical protein
VRKRGRLRLHTVGVSGNDGLLVLAGDGEQLFPRDHQSFVFPQKPVAQRHACDGRADILTTSTDVKPRGILSDDGNQLWFEIEIIGRAWSARGVLVRDHLPDAICNAGGDRSRHESALLQHDDRCLVDLIEEFDRPTTAPGARVKIRG